MPITYEMMDSIIMTSKQCTDLWKPQLLGLSIFMLFALIFIAGIGFYHIYRFTKLKQFIKDNKLEKKYQEWRNDNKGLD